MSQETAPHHLIALLHSVRHFRALPQADLERIVRTGQVRRFSAGTVIFTEGTSCAGMFVLLSGQVHLRKLGPQGQESIMAVIDPVIMFNEVAVLDGGPNLVTAVAVQDCTTWQVGCAAFQELLQCYPLIGLGLLRVLAMRNRLLVSQVEDLSFRSVHARAAKLLLDLSDRGARPIDRRRHPNHEMAARIATVPEAFSRALNTFRRNDCVASTRATIHILRPVYLADLAEQSPIVSRE